MARLVTYSSATGPRSGLLRDDEVIDLQESSGGLLPPTLEGLFETLTPDEWRPAVAHAAAGTPVGTLAETDLLVPMSRPPKLLAAAANYQAHIDEEHGQLVDPARTVPKLFMKPSTTLIGPDMPVRLPSVSSKIDWELELAVVIGVGGRNIPVTAALDHVAGYTILNDVSARVMDWGLADREEYRNDGFFDWLMGKWPDGFAPMGPWIVTADEIPDPQALALELRVNGDVMQTGSTAEMIFGCAELIAFASRFVMLEPGDVIATGTVAGTGKASDTFLAAGDVMEGWIEGIGTLRTPVEGSAGA